MPTFEIMLDPRSPIKQDGTRAIVLQVSELRNRNYIPVGLSVKPEHWDATLSKFKRAHDPLTYKELNYNLNRYIIDSEKIISDFGVNKIPFSFC